MATKRDKTQHVPRPLSVEQLNAVDLLTTGAPDAAVAAAVGVHRVTVTKWRSSPMFAAALNRRRAELFASVADSLRGDLLPRALAVLGEALTNGCLEKRTAAALDLLRIVRVSATPTGPTDPRDFVAEEVDRRQRIDGTRLEQLSAKMEHEPCPAARFAAAWNEMELDAVEPAAAEPATVEAAFGDDRVGDIVGIRRAAVG